VHKGADHHSLPDDLSLPLSLSLTHASSFFTFRTVVPPFLVSLAACRNGQKALVVGTESLGHETVRQEHLRIQHFAREW
jgi:hypothetical protein